MTKKQFETAMRELHFTKDFDETSPIDYDRIATILCANFYRNRNEADYEGRVFSAEMYNEQAQILEKYLQ